METSASKFGSINDRAGTGENSFLSILKGKKDTDPGKELMDKALLVMLGLIVFVIISKYWFR